MNRVDPTGLDWYKREYTSDIGFTEGSANWYETSDGSYWDRIGPTITFTINGVEYYGNQSGAISRITPINTDMAERTDTWIKTTETFLTTIGLNAETGIILNKYVPATLTLIKGAKPVLKQLKIGSGRLAVVVSVAKAIRNPNTKNIVSAVGNLIFSLTPTTSVMSGVGDLTGISDKAYTKIANFIDYGACQRYCEITNALNNYVIGTVSYGR